MSHFVMGVTDLVTEECRTAMLHDDITVDRLMVYKKSIEESKLKRMDRNLKGVHILTMNKLGLRRGLKVKKKLGVLR